MQWIFLYNPILSKMVYNKWDKVPKRQKNLPPIEKKPPSAAERLLTELSISFLAGAEIKLAGDGDGFAGGVIFQGKPLHQLRSLA